MTLVLEASLSEQHGETLCPERQSRGRGGGERKSRGKTVPQEKRALSQRVMSGAHSLSQPSPNPNPCALPDVTRRSLARGSWWPQGA